MESNTIDQSSKGLTNFPTDVLENCYSLNLSSNPIQSLKGLNDLNNLTKLNLDQTQISSLSYSKKIATLKELSLSGTPIEHNEFLTLNCIIAFGQQMESVNNKKVTDEEKNYAKTISSTISSDIRSGWLITSTDPLTLENSETKETKIIDLKRTTKTNEKNKSTRRKSKHPRRTIRSRPAEAMEFAEVANMTFPSLDEENKPEQEQEIKPATTKLGAGKKLNVSFSTGTLPMALPFNPFVDSKLLPPSDSVLIAAASKRALKPRQSVRCRPPPALFDFLEPRKSDITRPSLAPVNLQDSDDEFSEDSSPRFHPRPVICAKLG